jgi:hypothetical protein
MTAVLAIVCAGLWTVMVWFFLAPVATLRGRAWRAQGRHAGRTASVRKDGAGSGLSEPGMRGGVAGSIAVEDAPPQRDSSLRSAA